MLASGILYYIPDIPSVFCYKITKTSTFVGNLVLVKSWNQNGPPGQKQIKGHKKHLVEKHLYQDLQKLHFMDKKAIFRLKYKKILLC